MPMKNNPTDSKARLAAASLAIQLERPQEAEQLGLNQPQNDPAIRLLRGRIQMQKGDAAGSVRTYSPTRSKAAFIVRSERCIPSEINRCNTGRAATTSPLILALRTIPTVPEVGI
jgi:hypothetical protein